MSPLRANWVTKIFVVAFGGALLGGCPASRPAPADAVTDVADVGDVVADEGDVEAEIAPPERWDVPDGDVADPEDDAGEVTSLRPTGAPCTSDAECVKGLCIRESLDRRFVGGYCSGLCWLDDPASCDSGAVCFDAEIVAPICAAVCETDADCRTPDYVCIGTCVPDEFTSPLARPGILTGTEPTVAAFVAAANDERMMGHVRVLAGETPWESPHGPITIVSRAVGHPDRLHAADYLQAELTALGWSVQRQEFEPGSVNLVAERRGTNPTLAPVVVTAHWDSTAVDTPGWNAATDPAPGAVDNGSGVAVALEVAAILADPATAPPPRTVRIVLFDAEEVGLRGSAAYVAGLGPDAPFACAINVDMIGWETPPTAGRFWYAFSEQSREWAALGVEAIDRFVPQARVITTTFGEAGGSDHISFWRAGLCAVGMASWPRELTNHTVDDTSATFEPIYATNARAALAVVAAWSYALADP